MSTNNFDDGNISGTQAIDSEDGEEMNIYANIDDHDDYDEVHACRGTEDNKKNSTSQHTGTDTQIIIIRKKHFKQYSGD